MRWRIIDRYAGTAASRGLAQEKNAKGCSLHRNNGNLHKIVGGH